MLQLHNTVTWHCKVEVSLSKTLKLGNAEENRPKPISVNARLGVEDCYLHGESEQITETVLNT